jgi:hypothetical protein
MKMVRQRTRAGLASSEPCRGSPSEGRPSTLRLQPSRQGANFVIVEMQDVVEFDSYDEPDDERVWFVQATM